MNLNTQIAALSCEFKKQINSLNSTLNDVERSLSLAWTNIEDLQKDPKAVRDPKNSYQKMMDDQNAHTAHLMKVLTEQKDENDKLRLSLKEKQEKLVALENHTKRENAMFAAKQTGRDAKVVNRKRFIYGDPC